MSRKDTVQRLRIFISSPSDVQAEREAASRAIRRLNALSAVRSRYLLEPLLYENEVPPAGGIPAQWVVDRYMAEPDDCFLLICLFWTRMGTPFTHPRDNKRYQSGTEYEWRIAYQSRRKRGYPHLLLYRKTAENPQADPEQRARVEAFFGRFHGASPEFQGLYKTFGTTAEFEELIYRHVEQLIFAHQGVEEGVMPEPRQSGIHIGGDVKGRNVAIGGNITVNDDSRALRIVQIQGRIAALEKESSAHRERIRQLERARSNALREVVNAADAHRDRAAQQQGAASLIGLALVAGLALIAATAAGPLAGVIAGVAGVIAVIAFTGRMKAAHTPPERDPKIVELDTALDQTRQSIRDNEAEIARLNRELQGG